MWRFILLALITFVAVLGASMAQWPEATHRTAMNIFDPPNGRPQRMDAEYRSDLNAFLDANGITTLRARDIARQGRGNSNLSSEAYGMNTLPPRESWPRAVATLKVLEAFMVKCACRVHVLSGFRSLAYNTAIGGVISSQHMDFVAIDFWATKGTPRDWRRILQGLRRDGMFQGGIGLYRGFIHLDTRGTNADWDLSR